MRTRDCLTPVLGACMVGAAIATLLCAIALNGHGRLYEEMERTKKLSQPFVGQQIPRVLGSYAKPIQRGDCGQYDGGGWHQIECPKVQP